MIENLLIWNFDIKSEGFESYIYTDHGCDMFENLTLLYLNNIGRLLTEYRNLCPSEVIVL